VAASREEFVVLEVEPGETVVEVVPAHFLQLSEAPDEAAG
jgi:hypothetical protein